MATTTSLFGSPLEILSISLPEDGGGVSNNTARPPEDQHAHASEAQAWKWGDYGNETGDSKIENDKKSEK